MINLNEIWKLICEAIKTQMTSLSYNAWIEPIEPLIVKNGILVLQIPSREILKTLSDFYFDFLVDAAKKASPAIDNVLLVLPEDRDKYLLENSVTPKNDAAGTLNPKYTFDSFVVGSSNHFPHAAALAVAESPGSAYNPFFIYGGVGLGKTHLMQAIGHKVIEKNPHASVIYVTSETFTNELINAIQQDKRLEFRNRYRNVDVLMIDDVQFISKSQATQEEFFNTFNTLHNANKQIVISSDRPPKEIPKLEERLCSRFEWGLIADIQPPDIETRIAILRNRAQSDNIEIKDEIINYIAENVHSNIRELEGCLTRVIAYAQLHRQPLDLNMASEALKDLLPEVQKKPLDAQRVLDTVGEYYNITTDTILSQRRDRYILLPRQVCMYLCHELLNMTHQNIGKIFGKSDHTTSMNACSKIENMLSKHETVEKEIEDIKSRLK